MFIKNFWDRSALYALRGLFYSGEADTGCNVLEKYTYVPSKWDKIEINNILLLGDIFNISVLNGECYKLTINDEKIKINKGEKYVYNKKKVTV